MVIQLIMIVMDHRVPRSTVSAPERSRHLIGWIRLRTRALIGLARGRNWGRVAQQSGACRGCLSLVRLSPLHLRHREAVIARHWYICQYVSRVEERAGDLLMMTWNWGGHSRWTFWTFIFMDKFLSLIRSARHSPDDHPRVVNTRRTLPQVNTLQVPVILWHITEFSNVWTGSIFSATSSSIEATASSSSSLLLASTSGSSHLVFTSSWPCVWWKLIISWSQ